MGLWCLYYFVWCFIWFHVFHDMLMSGLPWHRPPLFILLCLMLLCWCRIVLFLCSFLVFLCCISGFLVLVVLMMLLCFYLDLLFLCTSDSHCGCLSSQMSLREWPGFLDLFVMSRCPPKLCNRSCHPGQVSMF